MTKETGIAVPKTAEVPTIIQNPAALTAETIIIKALEKGVSVEVLERIFVMRDKLKAEFAKEAYNADMALAQAEMPVIERKTPGGKTNSGDKPAYYYAQLGDIAKAVQPIIHKHGFSYSMKAEVKESGVKATCIVTHKFGHSEESSVEFPMTTKTSIMSAPQVVAATMTFAKRYAFCNAFGIMTAEEDKEEWLEQRVRSLEDNAFAKIRGRIEGASDKDLGIQIAFLEKELKAAKGMEDGVPAKDEHGRNMTPALGLKASQYQSLLAIAKARVGGVIINPTAPISNDGKDDAGFAAAMKQ